MTDENEASAVQKPVVVVLVFDVGSSSIRCSAFNKHSACCVAYASEQLVVVDPATGRLNLDYDDEDHNDENGEDSLNHHQRLWNVMDSCMDQVLTELSGDVQVDAVGFSSLVMNLVGVDENGRPVGSDATLTYASSSHPGVMQELEKLHEKLGTDKMADMYEKTGCYVGSASYAVAQLLAGYRSFNEESSVMFNKVYKWQSIASVALFRWLDFSDPASVPISYSEASWTGLLNYRACCYDPEVMQLLPSHIQSALPLLADFDGYNYNSTSNITADSLILPSINDRYGRRWPALTKARFFLGIGDGAGANLGSKCSLPSRIACTVGTSAAARVVLPCAMTSLSSSLAHANGIPEEEIQRVDSPQLFSVPFGLFCYRVDRHRVLLGGALTDGGSIVEWATKFLNLNIDEFRSCLEQINDLLVSDYDVCRGLNDDDANRNSVGIGSQDNSSKSRITSHALTMVPFLSGERSTGFRSEATGALIGITRLTEPMHLIRACLESVTLRLRAIIVDRLLVSVSALSTEQHLDKQLPQIIVSGKALEANSLWRQIIADCTGLDVVLDSETIEGTSRGVAILLTARLRQEESKSLLHTDEDGHRLRQEEEIPLKNPLIARPRPGSSLYWDRAAAAQEGLIDAVAPLF